LTMPAADIPTACPLAANARVAAAGRQAGVAGPGRAV